ncbi:hypothetical protein IAC76_08510, partial [Spirochaetes bacterium]|nr:hypothetical protein [Candidatus Scatousia excrementipullorum]
MEKPQKPENLLPNSFGGEKENFSEDKIATGYQPDVPDILGGANLNYMLDAAGKNFEYNNKISDFIVNMPVGQTITVDENNQLSYLSFVGQGLRNLGEIVTSTLPLTDAGLHLLDGSLLQGGGIYNSFVSYIANLYETNSTASYFATEEDWQASVSSYG